jgi:small subunit ribosomal protein S13
MALVAGVNIPDNKRLATSLQQIYGIGLVQANDVVMKSQIDGNPRVKDMTDEELDRIRTIVEKEKVVEGDLRREVNLNIRRLIDIGTFAGQRHRRNLPVRGQRTRTNARSKRGRKATVAGRRHTVTK